MNESSNSNRTSQSQATSSKATKFLTNGGRHLNAIRYSKLSSVEKSILHEIACQLDFRSDFLSPVKLSQTNMAKMLSMSKRTIIRATISLETKKYITIKPSENSTGNFYSLTKKIFDEYSLACEETSRANKPGDSESQVSKDQVTESHRGVTQSHRGGDSESYQSSLSSPFLFPIYLGAKFGCITGKSAIAQIRRYDNINYKLYKEKSMSLSEHPFMTTLKNGKAEREAKKPHIEEAPKPRSNLGETSNDLFNKYKNYFSGGFGKFCYKAQRAMWDKSTLNDCVEELKTTVEFHHGPDKHAACQIAAHRRMTDEEYAQHLLDEALGEKRRIAKEKADRQEQIDKARERARLEADPEWQAEQERQRKIRVEKLLAAREKLKRAIR